MRRREIARCVGASLYHFVFINAAYTSEHAHLWRPWKFVGIVRPLWDAFRSYLSRSMIASLEVNLEPETLLARARAKSVQAQGTLLELYRNYLTLLARLHMGPK